ncbi:tRNA epoxyqueuosine(34) reductase QueG [Desulfitobacterium sp.]|uniref:tRNA epoxyqueuosine(34) reductase QueG n=1 Tax=Desulfitobacterium sp. TaxID=49981 RepID=UPI0039C8A7F4
MEINEQLSWKIRLREFAESLGFIKIGFTGGQPLTELAHYLEDREQEGYSTPFVEANVTLRTDPQAVWAECKTVVVLAYPLPTTSRPKEKEGVIARSAVGEDYHRVLRVRLEELVQKLMEADWPSQPPHFQVDTGPLNERGFAMRSGLGWAGRNQQLILPVVGSFVTLALLLLDQELPQDEPLFNQCGTCQNCIQACPAQVLGKEHFAANQCISYLTQSKESLTDEQGKSIGQRLFGCDSCQEACPHNQGFIRREEGGVYSESEGENRSEIGSCCRSGNENEWNKNKSESKNDRDRNNGVSPGRGVDLYEVLTLTKAKFNEQFRMTAAGWRGKAVLQRNAYRIMENLQDERRIPWLKENKENEALPLLLRAELTRGNKEVSSKE